MTTLTIVTLPKAAPKIISRFIQFPISDSTENTNPLERRRKI